MAELSEETKRKYIQREEYCPNSSDPNRPCGDPIPTGGGKVQYTHRRMNFDGFDEEGFWSSSHYAYYTCPVCGQSKKDIGSSSEMGSLAENIYIIRSK